MSKKACLHESFVEGCRVCAFAAKSETAAEPIQDAPQTQQAAAIRRETIRLMKTRCLHRSEASTGRCGPCGGEAKYACTIYGETTNTNCMKCKDHTARAAPAMPMLTKGEPMQEPVDGISLGAVAEWGERPRSRVVEAKPSTIQHVKPATVQPKTDGEHRLLADHIFHNCPAYPVGRFSGKGIVIAAGGSYWSSAYVTVRMIRNVGCTLPIQIWYLGGRGERDQRYETLLAPFGVTCIDADDHPARPSRRVVNGFEVKLFAVMNCPFEEVLFLDADSYPCEDPTILFDQPGYREVGGIYWPDMPETDAWTKWNFWGVEPFPPSCGWETGQYVVNKRQAWQQLTLAEWYDDHSDWCYGAGTKGDHGDKGPHRVAWAKARIAPVFFSTQALWKSVAFVQPGPNGRPMFVHRCRSKFTVGKSKFTTTPQNGENIRGGLPLEKLAFDMLDELRRALPAI